MERLLYAVVWGLVHILQALPLPWAARVGRACGAAAFWLDARHRRTALKNLTLCFGEQKTPEVLRRLAQEHFRRLGENYCCAIKTAAMPWEKLQKFVEFTSIEQIPTLQSGSRLQSHIVAIGHFGNFELYARFGQFMPGFACATTYRALKHPSLNRLMQSLREQSGCRFYERRTDADALKADLNAGPLLLGLLADQHAGPRGLRVPFFGHDCSTTTAPAVLALRYHCPLYTAICYRIGLARWRIEAGDAIPTRENGQLRSAEAITRDINHAFEAAIRRDPANWFWVHKRWKPPEPRKRKRPIRPPSDLPAPPQRADVSTG